jgi:hypothetical protein
MKIMPIALGLGAGLLGYGLLTRVNMAFAHRLATLKRIKELCDNDIAITRLSVVRNRDKIDFLNDYIMHAIMERKEEFDKVTMRQMVLQVWKPISSFYREIK